MKCAHPISCCPNDALPCGLCEHHERLRRAEMERARLRGEARAARPPSRPDFRAVRPEEP